MKPKKPLPIVCYVNEGTSLEYILQQAHEAGVTDLSRVVLRMEYVGGCCGSHSEGEYCYAESGYNDIRFVVEDAK